MASKKSRGSIALVLLDQIYEVCSSCGKRRRPDSDAKSSFVGGSKKYATGYDLIFGKSVGSNSKYN